MRLPVTVIPLGTIGYEPAPKVLSATQRCTRCANEMAWEGFGIGPRCFPEPMQRTAASIAAIPYGWANGPRRGKNGILINGRT